MKSSSREEAMKLHRKHGTSERIVKHCETVAGVAMILVDGYTRRGIAVDSASVAEAALLHDIGRNLTQGPTHGHEGAELLKREGASEIVVETVRRHVGAGLSPQEAAALGLPPLVFIPETTEQVIVCFADKMIDSDRVRPFELEVERFRLKGHDVGRLMALKERVTRDLGEDPEALIFGKLKASR